MARGKQYDEAFKIETVKYISENNKPVAQVASEVGVSVNTVHGWVKKYGQQPEVKAVQTFSSEVAELRALQKEIRDLKEENEILKKAMHYFAKSPRQNMSSSKNTAPNTGWSENILDRQFKASKPNQLWVTDITYIPTNEGWLYLASVMDLYSRKIVGWSMGETMTKELVISALKMAYKRQRPEVGVIHHSDRGVQYASHEYQKLLKQYKMIGSMSRKGNCYDNACIESFHGILKRELVYQTKYRMREEAKKSLFEYIEFFYNSKRIHSALGYFTPNEFDRMYGKSSA
ncbi:IS3 family transposase [Neobacillus novalis]|uniref:IS3 family transposase n=1 Tax=Neobacillus novalis TaxID=220687 RepID=A0AA95SBP9_9BACI|nr:IS3 family transposase [Neobacillus novalis]WHY86804.1 IS3 family transposase [Neobacillus novalis]